MTSSETTFNDKELIARWDDYVESMGSVMGEVEHMAQQMRDRIEQLAVTNEALTAENAKLHDHTEGVAKDTHKIMVGYEAKLAENEVRLRKAEAGLLAIAKRDEQMIWGEDYEVEEAFKDMRDISCATLAEIKGLNKGESHE